MDTGMLLGLDPTGTEVMALCVLAALALAVIIGVGFALVWRGVRGAREAERSAGPAPRELGLLALWRLERSLQRSRVGAARAMEPPVGAEAGAGGRV